MSSAIQENISKKSREKVDQLTTYVMYSLGLMIIEMFPNITEIDDFVNAMNENFGVYQTVSAEKIDPVKIMAKRKISCSSAAMIIGLWWMISQQRDEPVYWVKNVNEKRFDDMMLALESESLPKTRAHVTTQLPLDTPRFLQLWQVDRKDRSIARVIDFPEERLKDMMANSRAIKNTPKFFGNRVALFHGSGDLATNAKSEFSSYQHYINNYELLISELRRHYQ